MVMIRCVLTNHTNLFLILFIKIDNYLKIKFTSCLKIYKIINKTLCIDINDINYHVNRMTTSFFFFSYYIYVFLIPFYHVIFC